MNTKTQPNRPMFLGLALLALALPATAQLVPQPASPTPPAKETKPIPIEETVTLSPFEVRTDKDYGYVATNTLSGTRINSRVKDVGSQISIFNAELIKDIGASTVEQAAAYAIGTQRDYVPDQQETQAISNAVKVDNTSFRVRGLTGVGRSRNYFAWSNAEIDLSTTDRIEFSRGPNSILFGLGSPSGIINVATKTADVNRTFANVDFRWSNFNQKRVSIDANYHSKDKRFALRLVPLRDHSDTWRDTEYRNRDGLYGTATFLPFKKTKLRLEFERTRTEANLGRSFTAMEATSYWEAVGRPVLAPSAYTITNDPATGLTNARPTIAVENQGTARVSGLMTGSGRYNGANGGVANVFISETGNFGNWGFLPLANGMVHDITFSAYAYDAQTRPLAADDQRFAINRLPRTANLLGKGLPVWRDFTSASAFWEQEIVKNLHTEIAANQTNYYQYFNDSVWSLNSLGGDASSLLPNGALNPNAGKYFVETPISYSRNEETAKNARATASYVLDLNQRNKWLGLYNFAGLLERREVATKSESGREVLTKGIFSPGNTVSSNNNAVNRRNYVDLNDPKTLQLADWRLTPINDVLDVSRGVRVSSGMLPNNASARKQITTTKMFVAQAFVLRDYLVGTIGKRSDTLKDIGSDTVNTTAFEYTNVPTAVLNEQTRSTYYSGTTNTKGIVGHPFEWLSLYYNKSDNFALPTAGQRVFTANPVGAGMTMNAPNTTGKGKDYGVRINGLFGNRVFLTFNKFENSGTNFLVSNISAQAGYRIRNITYAIFAHDPARLSGTSLVEAFDNVMNTNTNNVTAMLLDRSTKGTEVELTANLTKQWRLLVGYSRSKTVNTNVGKELANFVRTYNALFTSADVKIMRYQDYNAGNVLGGGRLGNGTFSGASPALDTSTVPLAQQADYFPTRGTGAGGVTGNLGLVNTVGEMWQWVQDRYQEDNFSREGQRPTGEVPEQWSLRTNYRFAQGKLKGLSVGGGYRWQAGAVAGVLSTKADAAGIQRVIPVADRSAIRADAIALADLNIGYQRKIFRDRINWDVTLNINNVFDNKDKILTNIFADGRPRYYRWNEPRRIMVSSTFGF
jgi:iron complex outermembrane receptor protein